MDGSDPTLFGRIPTIRPGPPGGPTSCLQLMDPSTLRNPLKGLDPGFPNPPPRRIVAVSRSDVLAGWLAGFHGYGPKDGTDLSLQLWGLWDGRRNRPPSGLGRAQRLLGEQSRNFLQNKDAEVRC